VTTIGVIGAGHIGRNFSLAAIACGYEIVISNRGGPDTIADLVSELGPKARAATVPQAAEAGDFSLVAIPLTGLEAVPSEPFAGKIVLTTCNYFVKRDGPIADIDSGRLTVLQHQEAHFPASKLVRVFNHIDAAQIVSDGTPAGTPNRRALAYAGDEPGAQRLAAELYDEFGFDAIDAGGAADAWRLDVDQPTFVVRQNADELKANLAKAKRHVAVGSQLNRPASPAMQPTPGR
jgi:8-hydroxy-5-deazaflavin:NADPH oxidoreductase